MNKHPDQAGERFSSGLNCAQSVLAAFGEETGMEEGTALALAASFGGGMGRLREVCGAVTGMFMVAGLIFANGGKLDSQSKAAHYRLIQDLAGEFRDKFGTIVCRELLGLPGGPDLPVPCERTREYYEKRPCEEYVRFAAEILDKHITETKRSEK